MSVPLGLFLTVVFLAVNAFFVAAEFAVTTSRRDQIEPLVKEGRRGAKQALFALQHVSLMLAISQLGITVMSTSLGAIAEPAIAQLIMSPMLALHVDAATAHAIALVLSLLLVLYLHVVFGEMVPKNLSISKSESTLLILAPVLVTFGKVLGPIVRLLDAVANWFIRHMGFEPKSEIAATYTLAEVANIVEVSREEGKLQDELGLLAGTLEFSRMTVAQQMVAASDLATIPLPATPREVEALVARTGFSRFPVTEGGEIVGYVHLKDVLYADDDVEGDQPIPSWRIRTLKTLPATLGSEDALRQMQTDSTHMVGITSEENGSLDGVLFLEDLLEELVGQVKDSMQKRP